MRPGDPRYRYLYTVWAFFECLIFAGLFYGWGSLVYVLKDEGLYLDLCVDKDDNGTDFNVTGPQVIGTSQNGSDPFIGDCEARNARFSLVFTIASSVFCVGCVAVGQINFKFGTRITRLIATVLFIGGALMIAFTNNEMPWLIFPGTCVMYIGGVTFFITNTQISNLFPAKGSSIIGLMCGGYDASSGMQLLIKIGYENGVTRSTSFVILACAHLLTLVSTLFFLPKDFVKVPTVNNELSLDVSDADNDSRLVNNKPKEEKIEVVVRKVPPLKSSIASPFYVIHTFWLSLLQLRFYFFLGSLNTLLEKLYDTKEEVSQSTNLFMYILICGLFASPFAGFVCDSQKRFFKNRDSHVSRVLMPTVMPIALSTVLCIVWSGLMLLEDPQVLFAIYVVVLLFRSFLYTIGTGFLSAFFPVEHFGILYGLMLLFAGITCLLQYPLFSWAEASGFNQVNIFFLVLVFVSFIHPLYIWRRCYGQKRGAGIN